MAKDALDDILAEASDPLDDILAEASKPTAPTALPKATTAAAPAKPQEPGFLKRALNAAEVGLRLGTAGRTLGLLPTLGAAIDAAVPSAAHAFGPSLDGAGDESTYGGRFKKAKGYYDRALEDSRRQVPGSTAIEIATGAGSPLGKLLPQITRRMAGAAGPLVRAIAGMNDAAITSGIVTGLSNLDSKPVTRAAQAASDPLNAAVGALPEALPVVQQELSKFARTRAVQNALKVLKPSEEQARLLREKFGSARAGAEILTDMRTADGKGHIIERGNTPDEVRAKLEAKVEHEGARVGEIRQKASELGAVADPNELIKDLREVRNKHFNNIAGESVDAAEAATVDRELARVEEAILGRQQPRSTDVTFQPVQQGFRAPGFGPTPKTNMTPAARVGEYEHPEPDFKGLVREAEGATVANGADHLAAAKADLDTLKQDLDTARRLRLPEVMQKKIVADFKAKHGPRVAELQSEIQALGLAEPGTGLVDAAPDVRRQGDIEGPDARQLHLTAQDPGASQPGSENYPGRLATGTGRPLPADESGWHPVLEDRPRVKTGEREFGQRTWEFPAEANVSGVTPGETRFGLPYSDLDLLTRRTQSSVKGSASRTGAPRPDVVIENSRDLKALNQMGGVMSDHGERAIEEALGTDAAADYRGRKTDYAAAKSFLHPATTAVDKTVAQEANATSSPSQEALAWALRHLAGPAAATVGGAAAGHGVAGAVGGGMLSLADYLASVSPATKTRLYSNTSKWLAETPASLTPETAAILAALRANQ